MVNRLVVRGCLAMMCLAGAHAGNFTIEDLKGASNANQDAFSSSSQRLKSLQNQGLEVLDHNSVIYEISDRTFPGYILPNGTVVPAIVNSVTGDRKPACLDKYFQRHLAEYDPASGMVTCKIREADLLDVADNQKSVGSKIARPQPGTPVPEPEADAPVLVEKHSEEPVVNPVPVPDTPVEPPETQSEPKANASIEPRDSRPRHAPAQTPAPPKQSLPDDLYLPPIRSAGTSNSSGLTMVSSTENDFGVTKGTWVSAEIQRRVRSSDRGEIELHTLETIYGEKKTIPAGTRLFATPSFNGGSQRLDLTVTNFIFEGETESMKAVVYDRSKEFGIAGKLIRDRESEVASAGSEALMATVGSAVSNIPFAGDPLSEGAESMTDSMIGYESGYLPDARAAVVEVPPQVVYIQIMASF
ncbi:conjugative transposon protein TraM [Reinekea blandensis]|uniref:Conjugative transposon TraM C-terminal domain-containing protein n=1 Tax=Reinekea blandensis MED297 TaxID=314283 RepID=A4BJX9_9GAMM|nr:conjugative transposon protein TraM [Reinekea blandensis]EAR07580.1 hypothetical protein MED297_00125 [Reinekea sp. MED297] [Reinekea blandensis MED297]